MGLLNRLRIGLVAEGVGGRLREGGMWMCSQLRCDGNCWCVCISWLSCGSTLYFG